MEALAAAAASPAHGGLEDAVQGPDQSGHNGAELALAEEPKAALSLADAALLLGQSSQQSGPQPILELPHGLPGQAQVGPKYKRGRGRSFFKEQPKKGAVCQVPGCDRSLHKLRDYYKRYKICPYHLELPCLVVEGQTIRFCQQCGRFQLLSDFEGDRRSCRRKLDKHNERRRKAEAEQKARMMNDSGSDSPGGSTRGNKAHRISPYGGGGAGYASHAALMLGMGGPDDDLTNRLKALANDPTLREGMNPGLLQSLADPGVGGMDWLAAGSLTNLALGPAGGVLPLPPPPMPAPQSASQEVQQQVVQQGTGILNGTLLQQLQQLGQPTPAAPVQPEPLGQRSFPFGLFGSSAPAPQVPQPPAQAPYGSSLPPGGVAALLGPSLQQQLQLHQPAQRSQLPGGVPDLLPATLDGASVFMQAQQVQQLQVQQAVPQALQAAVPLLRSEPLGLQPKAEAALTGTSDKAALLVALAKSVGVSSEDLAKALVQGGDIGQGLNGNGMAVAAAMAAGVSSAPAGAPGAAPTAAAVAQPQAQAAMPLQQVQQAPLLPPQQQQQQQPALSQPASVSMQQQASESLGRGNSGMSQPMSLTDGGQLGSASGAATNTGLHQGLLGVHPGAAFKAPTASSGPAVTAGLMTTAGSSALPSSAQPAADVAAAVAAAPAVAPAAPVPARPALDLEQLQHAVQNGGLNPGYANDANLLLQLVAAVEAQAQRDAPPGNERMHSLSIKLFNCTPDRLPNNILEQLEKWIAENRTLLDSASRPGCVQLSVSALMDGEEFRALSDSLAGMLQRFACGGLGNIQTSIMAQLDGRAALLDMRKQNLVQLDTAGSGGVVPELCSVRPLAVTPSYSGPILVTGCSIGDPQDTIFCRNGDRYPMTEVLGRGVLMRFPGGCAGDKQWALLRIPSLQEGCHQLEAQRGIFVSAPHSLLVLDDEEAVQELRQLEAADDRARNVPELLHRLGAVLRFGRQLRGGGAGTVHDSVLLDRVSRAAQELAAVCMLRGWSAVLRLVLPVACANCPAAEAVAAIQQQLQGMPLLHAAVLTGGPKVVQTLCAWAAAAGYTLHLDARWGGGLTALHVAALLREPESVAVALTDLFPSAAPALWAAACANHDGETPLGLACRLNKRGLLRELALHGVAAAGAMLAALQLQDEASAGMPALPAAAQKLPTGVEDASKELGRQQRQWSQVYAKAVLEQGAQGASQGTADTQPGHYHSWPGNSTAGSSKLRAAVDACATKPAEASRSGQESPSSVLSPLREACCAAASILQQRADSMDSEQSIRSDELEPQPGSAAACKHVRAEQAGAASAPAEASFYLPFKLEDPMMHGELLPHGKHGGKGELIQGKSQAQALVHAPALLWSFQDGDTERRFHKWHTTKLSKMDSVVFTFLALLFCAILASAPISMRQQLHMWLLSTVARAPLLLQPLLLLCPPARQAYRRCRDTMLVALHVGMFGLQYWAVHAHGLDWLSRNVVLTSYPAGLWLLVAVFTFQLRFALQVPALLLMYLGNITLLPAACKHGMSVGAVNALSTCVATGGIRMFVVAVALPLLAAWLMEARARTVFAAVYAGAGATA